ncbi:MAG TPA: hydroxymethylbilane synthase, partial [Longimicrobiales bacterium]|nr:hydroxymethylbilane synthase [Longimicrobiales bacterium]
MTRLRLGTRGSRLATTQARWVARRLEQRAPGLSVELMEIATLGDRISGALGPERGSSFFTKEIEAALRDGRIDAAVHSCKDLATAPAPGLLLAAVPVREDPRDALVGGPAGGFAALPPGATVGTGSPRRQAFLSAARPDLVFVGLRGNVPTRVARVDEGAVDAVVLAVAGLRRLGLEDRITGVLDEDTLPPAAAQGALAVQVRADDAAALELAARIDDAAAHAEVRAERACLRALEAGCMAPVGVLARPEGEDLVVRAAVAAPGRVVRATARGPAAEAERTGARVAAELLAALGLASLRD